ncbi:MAG: discoidin domain-containing protein, partial [Chloroflexota bacterium]|nr:discoidin domain-containing protein [Chloroflexota bacterium]
MATEREPAQDAAACQRPEGLSPRGAEILCAVSESEDSTLDYKAKNATPLPEPDALDGDPLDGPTSKKRPPDPDNAKQLTIVQSGRQKDTPNSTLIYDGKLDTSWSPTDVDEPWVWVDLGDTETVRNVRWLAAGSGDVEISVSSDRKQWAVLDTQGITGGWQEITLREDAQYVRLTLLPKDDTSDVGLAEVEVFGRERDADASLAQKAKKGNQKRDKRRSSERAQKAAKADDEPASDDTAQGNQRTTRNSSAKAGKTKCSGKRERCRARPGKVEVTDECGGDGTCTIDIRADGGSAICDASGGDEDRAGDGEGKRGGGNGGRCEAVADG